MPARWWPTRKWSPRSAADERRRQGHDADPEPGRPRDHHASSTNPDITSPKFAEQVPSGRQADLFPHGHHGCLPGTEHGELPRREAEGEVGLYPGRQRSFGVGMADAFQKQAEAKGIKVLGRDRLDPKAADYTAILTKIKSMSPEALYYGGVTQAGVKLAKQSYDIIPNVIKAGPDGMYSPNLFNGAGFPAVEGWSRPSPLPISLRTQRLRSSSLPSRAGSITRQTTTRSPPTTARWSSSTASSGSPPRASP